MGLVKDVEPERTVTGQVIKYAQPIGKGNNHELLITAHKDV